MAAHATPCQTTSHNNVTTRTRQGQVAALLAQYACPEDPNAASPPFSHMSCACGEYTNRPTLMACTHTPTLMACTFPPQSWR
eukprot:183989-Chlamydomonas_euryale.AAC.1